MMYQIYTTLLTAPAVWTSAMLQHMSAAGVLQKRRVYIKNVKFRRSGGLHGVRKALQYCPSDSHGLLQQEV